MDLSHAKVGFRGAKTLSGISFDLAKSALQKYIRRGDAKKAMQMGMEMDIFRIIEGGQACWTNFFNRLRICYLEDIGMAYPELLLSIDWRMEEWKSVTPQSKMLMLTIIRDMALSKHSRYFSHLRHVCQTSPLIPSDAVLKYTHDLKDDEKIDGLRENVNGLTWCLENGNEKAWHFAEQILKHETLNVRRYGGFRSGFLVFEIIEHFLAMTKSVTHRKCFDVCLKWYRTMKMKEQFLCCMFAMTVLNKKLDPYYIAVCEEPLSSYQPFEGTIDEFAVDMHTLEGKQCGYGSTEFGVDGSLVSLDVCINPEFHHLYTQSKIGNIRKESEDFILKGRAQLICSAVRPDTYFATTRSGRHVVVKGPYSSYETTCQSFHLQAMMKRYTQVNTLDITIRYLFPDMFRSGIGKTTLGCRTTMSEIKPAYFVVMNDLCGLNEYPLKNKESKMWSPTPVIDFDKLFNEHSEFGFGVAENMPNENAIFSFAIQLTFRYIFKLGDFAARNFLRVNNKVWNLDVESIGMSNVIRLSTKNKSTLLSVIMTERKKFNDVLDEWIIENKISRNGSEVAEMLLVQNDPRIMFE